MTDLQRAVPVAVCSRDGVVKVSSSGVVPEGWLVLYAGGPLDKLERAVSVAARHAYDGETLLVPGLPEADTDDEAIEAAIEFRRQIRIRMTPKEDAA